MGDSKQEATLQRRRSGDTSANFLPSELEEAIAWRWASQIKQTISWDEWGDESQKPVESPPWFDPKQAQQQGAIAYPHPADRSGNDVHRSDEDDDVVVRARQSWPTPPGMADIWPHDDSIPRNVVAAPNVDPLSGLEAPEMPRSPPPRGRCGPVPTRAGAPSGSSAPAWMPNRSPASGSAQAGKQRPLEPVERLVEAPEFHEEFGTRAEHFQDPVPSKLGDVSSGGA